MGGMEVKMSCEIEKESSIRNKHCVMVLGRVGHVLYSSRRGKCSEHVT